jgi:citronellyl-CoA synthetase
MSQIDTIPNKIPKIILRDLKKGKYDNIILFTLAIYGPHRLGELINDPNKSIKNKMDKKNFQKWVEELKKDKLIEDFIRDNGSFYKITEIGKDELLKRLENTPNLNRLVNRLVSTFDGILGGDTVKERKESKINSYYTLSYRDYIFGLLSIDWRLNDIFEDGNKAGSLIPDENMSFGTILDYNAEHYANRPALYYNDMKYTYKELNEWINRYANYFRSLGFRKGDIINVLLENRPELMIIIGSMSKIGTIASLINTRNRSASLVHSLKVNKVKAYIIGEELYSAFEDVRDKLDLTSDDRLYFLKDKGKMDIPEGFLDLNEEVKDHEVTTPSVIADIKGSDPYAYIFTSGTTGLPKASPMRNIHMIGSIYAWGGMANNMLPEDIIYIPLPLFHSNAVHVGLASALRRGSAVALARKFSVRNFWKDIRKYKATCFNYIGELCRYLLNQPLSPDDRNHNVYKICGNGLRPEIWKEFKERFGIRNVHEHYGATEIRGMFCNYLNIDCTVGINFQPYVLVRYDIDADEPIRDKNGYFQKVEKGEAGLLLIKISDDTIFAGYTNKQSTEKKIIRNPFGNNETWLNTGDMLRYIGYYHAQFVDRLGDTFRWKGENVSTSEVEDILSSFEQIAHSSVYGVKIPRTEGRAGMASVVAKESQEYLNFNQLLNILKKNLPQYAIPKFIRVLSKLNTTSTFKIQKSDMKKVGFDITKTNDPIYVLLPESSEYAFLTEDIYNNIMDGKYRF